MRVLFLILGLAVFLAAIPCKDLVIADFPPEMVNKALNRFKIPVVDWSGIVYDLNQKSLGLEEAVKGKMRVQHLDPQTVPKLTASRIYREALYEAFSEVMKNHGLNDDKKIDDIFDELQNLKAQALWDCYNRELK